MALVKSKERTAILALAGAGALWGLSVPLTKLALPWLDAAWLTFARFALAAPLLALAGRRGLRDALTPQILGAGALGFGAVILLQNTGVERTSVTHAALIVAVAPVLVAAIAAGSGQAQTRPLSWGGYALALAGVGLIAGAHGGGASSQGDLLVLASAVLSAAFITLQPPLLAGREPAAVTAVQFTAGALVALPLAALTAGAPAPPAHPIPVVSLAVLSLAGTLLPFWLFAFGQARVPAERAAAFVNLEPVVGAATGWIALGNTATFGQLAGAVAVLAGIALGIRRPAPTVHTPTSLSPGAPRLLAECVHAARARPEARACVSSAGLRLVRARSDPGRRADERRDGAALGAIRTRYRRLAERDLRERS
jgi:drug/metabolite transporter (DMT)-like permease